MNHFIKILLILSSTIAFFSCSDEFVNEKLTVSGVAASAIIISPDWEADDYEFKLEDVENADFTISSKPDWLILDSPSGDITDSIATIHGSANAEPRFSNIGLYVDQMVVNAGGKQYAVPLYYITEGNPSVQVDREFEIATTNYDNPLHISNSGDGVLLWDIVSMPDWMSVNMSQFNPMSLILGKGATASLTFTFNIQAAIQNNLEGILVLKTNDKNNPLVEIAVSANLGNPGLHIYESQIDFGSSETTKTNQIYNQQSGVLIWSFEGLPEWLSVSTAGGIVMPYSSPTEVTFFCNRGILPPGLNSATFYLKSNDPEKSSVAMTVLVRVPGNSANIKSIEGNIFDATFDKSTNTMYYVTGQPNKLVAYDVTAKTVLHEVALSKAPTSLAIDEDFKQALVGQGGSISIVDLTSFGVSKTYTLNSTVYDLEWGINGWFCYTNTNSTVNLLWINSMTDETYKTPLTTNDYSLGTADLQKIPHQPYIIAQRKGVSPGGIFVFDLETKALKSYAHTEIGNVCFFKETELMVTGYSQIIRTSVVTAASGHQLNGPSAIGELKIGQYANVAWWTDYCAANHSIWTLFSYYPFSYSPPVRGAIYQFEDNDYTLVKTYTYDYMYQPEAQTAVFEVEARYVFSNSSGTELSVLRKGKDNNTWSVEFIPIQ